MALLLELIWAHLYISIIGKIILVLDEGPTQRLNDTTKNLINFTQSGKRLVFSLHYNENIIFWKVLQLTIWKKSRSKTSCEIFSVDFNPFETNDISDIHIYLMKGKLYKAMFRLIKKIFIGLLSGIVSACNHTKCVLQS